MTRSCVAPLLSVLSIAWLSACVTTPEWDEGDLFPEGDGKADSLSDGGGLAPSYLRWDQSFAPEDPAFGFANGGRVDLLSVADGGVLVSTTGYGFDPESPTVAEPGTLFFGVTRLTSEGEVTWSRRLRLSPHDHRLASSSTEMEDGSIAIAALMRDAANSTALVLLRLSASGEVLSAVQLSDGMFPTGAHAAAASGGAVDLAWTSNPGGGHSCANLTRILHDDSVAWSTRLCEATSSSSVEAGAVVRHDGKLWMSFKRDTRIGLARFGEDGAFEDARDLSLGNHAGSSWQYSTADPRGIEISSDGRLVVGASFRRYDVTPSAEEEGEAATLVFDTDLELAGGARVRTGGSRSDAFALHDDGTATHWGPGFLFRHQDSSSVWWSRSLSYPADGAHGVGGDLVIAADTGDLVTGRSQRRYLPGQTRVPDALRISRVPPSPEECLLVEEPHPPASAGFSPLPSVETFFPRVRGDHEPSASTVAVEVHDLPLAATSRRTCE